jgi:hypothetical protein
MGRRGRGRQGVVGVGVVAADAVARTRDQLDPHVLVVDGPRAPQQRFGQQVRAAAHQDQGRHLDGAHQLLPRRGEGAHPEGQEVEVDLGLGTGPRRELGLRPRGVVATPVGQRALGVLDEPPAVRDPTLDHLVRLHTQLGVTPCRLLEDGRPHQLRTPRDQGGGDACTHRVADQRDGTGRGGELLHRRQRRGIHLLERVRRAQLGRREARRHPVTQEVDAHDAACAGPPTHRVGPAVARVAEPVEEHDGRSIARRGTRPAVGELRAFVGERHT